MPQQQLIRGAEIAFLPVSFLLRLQNPATPRQDRREGKVQAMRSPLTFDGTREDQEKVRRDEVSNLEGQKEGERNAPAAVSSELF